ncbi:glutamine synthetase, type III [Leptolyngbya boryana NIES-2135]|jgi:glutamine synthetase|uniref:Glutamine synthetase, type III n=1 Tax=Leptolyngbya boryana NIES-2135 TaxID=1973484 RepID=A0A1Z4JMZ9_LEPBY|nr:MULTISPECIES: type III glutamate--ammonia ligase [Leptolyngbya]BAY58129.1 glutamine synthetase, type III [Leptolyngbya boryana NIES-2135]MBD1858416.1 type III glutamate--ammonia ligase [Leptolyngbya sp. FACHB-1624]MBD2369114.1 type III glutamate--ammonia ligase [Leptolyngbya sp. FACHB-161]MBD2375539.1 type III glutamate--ammonia ligase [Leptolyngbya sp. FACHB-238]MBD2400113.1 type III glutamate--ammonia ligase [Leptolyngbya sp. FACHB-239]
MTHQLNPDLQQFKTMLKDQGVKYAIASFVDIHGMCKAKMVPLSHFDQMMQGSELFTGAALDGVPQEVSDEEVATMPDLASATILPWNSEMVWLASDLYLRGQPFEACCRSILKSVLQQAAEMGFQFNLGIETEFFILKDQDGQAVPISDRDTLAKPCYDLQGLLDNYAWVDEIVQAMNHLGWDVYSFDHEDGNGQFETDFTYTDALTMSDRLIFFRLMVKEIARKHGYFATFMPKPFANRTGSGAHYNMSLADLKTGENLFVDRADPRRCGLSKLGYQFIAGVLRHAPAICAVIAPTVNSYKRLIARGSMSGFTWAPVYICYGNNNRTNMLRIPLAGGRVECRAADISCNPYLGAAMILAAGLEGIREGLDPGEPHTENMYTYTTAELAEMGIKMLPRTLGEAIEAFAADPLSESVMGSLMYQTYVDFKTQEWFEYHNHVSDWEVQRYMKFF